MVSLPLNNDLIIGNKKSAYEGATEGMSKRKCGKEGFRFIFSQLPQALLSTELFTRTHTYTCTQSHIILNACCKSPQWRSKMSRFCYSGKKSSGRENDKADSAAKEHN